jgi:hypothetical protein
MTGMPSVVDGVEDRPVEVRLAAAARSHAGDDLRAVLDALLRMKSALGAGETLHDQLRMAALLPPPRKHVVRYYGALKLNMT